MQKIIEKRLRENIKAEYDRMQYHFLVVHSHIAETPEEAFNNTIKQVASDIASDIQKEWKVVASGEVIDDVGYKIEVKGNLFHPAMTKIFKDLGQYKGKTIEIAVRILDEIKE